MDLTEIKTHRAGASYLLPVFEVQFGRGLIHIEDKMLDFVKGSKDDPSIFRQEGFTTETLLAVCKQYLMDVNIGPLEDDLTHEAIQYIDQALLVLHFRAEKRRAAGVQGTYKSIPDGPGETSSVAGPAVSGDTGETAGNEEA